jgi:hypothetical protein
LEKNKRIPKNLFYPNRPDPPTRPTSLDTCDPLGTVPYPLASPSLIRTHVSGHHRRFPQSRRAPAPPRPAACYAIPSICRVSTALIKRACWSSPPPPPHSFAGHPSHSLLGPAPVRRLLVGRCRGTSPSRLDKPQGDKATALTGAIPNACRSSCPTRTSLCLSISVRALSPRRRPRRPSAPVAISTRPFVSNHPEACAYLRLCHNVYQTPSPTCFFSISRRHPVPIYPHCGYRRWPHPTSLSNKSKRRP